MLKRFLSTFIEGDLALVRPLAKIGTAFLTKPLKAGQVGHTSYGQYLHSDIIGRPKRVYLEYASTKKERSVYIATEPTLDEYTSLIARKAQPIYSLDANAIVQMLAIEPDIPGPGSEPKHYLEAGTGNGSLTLSICKAIHGANALQRHFNDLEKRGAILHSIDRNEGHQNQGRLNVHRYKRGKYVHDVQFEVCELPSKWVSDKAVQLDGVFLDLPNPENYLADLAPRLSLEAPLIVFCPSVTQILLCRHAAADAGLTLVQAVELPPGNGGGSREWEINSVKTRATGDHAVVCRPKVGVRTSGGGFVGLFKRVCLDGKLA